MSSNAALVEANRRINSGGAALAAGIVRNLRALGRLYAARELAELKKAGALGRLAQLERERVRKARSDEREEQRLIDELSRLLAGHGMTRLRTAAGRGAATVTRSRRRIELPDRAVMQFLAAKDVRLQRIIESTRQDVKNSVRTLLVEGLAGDPPATPGELARRLSSQFHGALGAGGEPLGSVEAGGGGVLPTRLVTTPKGLLYAFSPERSALIVRSELAQADNEGLVLGYKAVGLQRIAWIAIKMDRRSGPRMHWKMKSKERDLDGPWFKLPSGAEMPYPGYWDAPISETANCRCSTRPVVVRRN